MAISSDSFLASFDPINGELMSKVHTSLERDHKTTGQFRFAAMHMVGAALSDPNLSIADAVSTGLEHEQELFGQIWPKIEATDANYDALCNVASSVVKVLRKRGLRHV